MSPTPAIGGVRPELAEYAARIGTHLARFGQGHDPLGHLFAIERLARAARAEERQTESRAWPGRDR